MFYVYFFFACAIEARKSGSLKARMRDSDAIGGSTRRNHEKKFTRNTKRKRTHKEICKQKNKILSYKQR